MGSEGLVPFDEGGLSRSVSWTGAGNDGRVGAIGVVRTVSVAQWGIQVLDLTARFIPGRLHCI